MFKLFRRNKNRFATVRANELRVGDRFVFGLCTVEVLDTFQIDDETIVRLGPTHPGALSRTWSAALFNELLITVAR